MMMNNTQINRNIQEVYVWMDETSKVRHNNYPVVILFGIAILATIIQFA